MANSVGTAYLTLVPKLDANFASQAEMAGDVFGKGFSGKIAGAAKVGAVAMAATVASVTMAAGAFKNAITATADYGDNVDKMSQKIGISAQSYQQWSYVMERAGTSVDVLQTGMKTLSTQAQKNASEFQQLGISEQEVASLSQEDLFGRVISGLSGMEEGTERTALATKLLGRAGTELGPLLNEGSAAIEEQMDMAKRYGLVMSDEAVKASADFKDSLTTLDGALRGAKNAMMAEFLPSVTQMSDGLAMIVAGDIDQGIQSISDGLTTMLGKLQEALPKFLENGGKIVLEMLNGLDAKAPEIINGLVDLIMSLIQSIPTYLPVLFSAAVKLFMGLVQAGPAISGSLMSAIASLVMQGVSYVAGSVGEMLGAAITWIGGVVSGVASMAGNVLSSVQGIIAQAPGAVLGFVGDMVSAGANLVAGIAEGLSPSVVIGKIRSICAGAVDAIKSFFGIHSPSRVMRDLFGYVGEGMALGLEDSEGDIERSMGGLLDTAYGMADGFGVGIGATGVRGSAVNADVVAAIDALHKDLRSIIASATPDGITDRQFARLVRQYA